MNELTCSDLPPLRTAMAKLGLVVAQIDLDLRYVWVENPQPGLEARTMVGRRDDELVSAADAAAIMRLKYDALREGRPLTRVLRCLMGAGERYYAMSAYPFQDEHGQPAGLFMVGFEAFRRATESAAQAA